ncbi:MAG: alpha/beta fold hydrolase [Burkholderiales bacterium]|nr:alpha/beta fold hydrolase [Burkholderiales bacterium]
MSVLNATAPNPAAGFYATPAARLLGGVLRAAHRWSPPAATRLALQLFFTPFGARRDQAVPAPWRATSHRFESGALVTWQRADVAPGAPRVLLVHGWAGDGQQWRALGDRLAAAGLDPVLLDLPAHGSSQGRRSNLPQWVRALFSISATMGPWHGLAAHSLGALASAHAVARGLPVQRLALVATSPVPRLFLRWFASALGPGEPLAARMQGWIERHYGVPLAQFEPAWLAPRVGLPALMVHDRDDRTAPLEGAQRLQQALPGAELHLTQGLGHRRILADDATLDRLTRHFSQPPTA